MIRLATAHAKLRLDKQVRTSDIDIAVKLIHLSIFGENMDDEEEQAPKQEKSPAAPAAIGVKKSNPKKRVKFDGGATEDEDVEIEDDLHVPEGTGPITRRAKPSQAKKMKVDEDQEVTDLFASSIRFDGSPIDISVKKFVYRLISEVSNQTGSSKVPIKQVWQKYFALTDEQQKNNATGKPYLQSKEDLQRTLEQMEADENAMIDGADVILTGQ
jgi:hypothetical protein